MSTIKVSVRVTVEFDPQDWADTFGLELGDVRTDAKAYLETEIEAMPIFASEVPGKVLVRR